MNRRQRRERPSLFKPAASIYVDEDQEDEIEEKFENEFVPHEGSSEFGDAAEGWDEEFEDDWEEAEEIIDSVEFVVAATMVASRGDRRSFIQALHREPPTPI